MPLLPMGTLGNVSKNIVRLENIYQSTGLYWCCNKYGDFSFERRFALWPWLCCMTDRRNLKVMLLGANEILCTRVLCAKAELEKRSIKDGKSKETSQRSFLWTRSTLCHHQIWWLKSNIQFVYQIVQIQQKKQTLDQRLFLCRCRFGDSCFSAAFCSSRSWAASCLSSSSCFWCSNRSAASTARSSSACCASAWSNAFRFAQRSVSGSALSFSYSWETEWNC